MLIAAIATIEMIFFIKLKGAESFLQPQSSLCGIVAMIVL